MVFRDWLGSEMERQGLSRREVARRMAEKHPSGVTPQTTETYRRAIRRYLDVENPQRPTAPTRNAIADALDVPRESVPTDDEEEEDLQLALLLRACQARNRRKQLPPRLEEWLRWGIRNGVFNEFARKELAA